MSPLSDDGGAPAADGGHRSKRQKKRAARRRAALEVKLASADRLIEKRRSQLRAASDRRGSIAAKLARVPGPDGETSAPTAYCIKDRQHVAIGGAHVITPANGRPAVPGPFPSGGSKGGRPVKHSERKVPGA